MSSIYILNIIKDLTLSNLKCHLERSRKVFDTDFLHRFRLKPVLSARLNYRAGSRKAQPDININYLTIRIRSKHLYQTHVKKDFIIGLRLNVSILHQPWR